MEQLAGNASTRILVVDDESAIVSALLSTLREAGYEAAGATSPSEALKRIRVQRFDVLLTDLHLPEMDGLALLRAALEIDPAILAIVMTGHGSVDTAVDAMKAGAIDYLLKPFKLRALQSVVSRALAMRALRRENEALQRSLAARTHELEAANKELEAFSYSVSHDLRAPLRAVGQFTEVLIEECLAGHTENVREYGARIQRGVHRMNGMIEDLLQMGKAVRAELKRDSLDLTALCEEIAAKLRARAPDRRSEWRIAEGMVVEADAGLLTIVLENLLDNAWKYTGGRDLAKISVALVASPGEPTVSVRDNGVGFEMAEARQLFLPFHRLRSASGFEGTGVGLATVQRVIHRHGGRVWAEAEPGKGAGFFFTLPRTSAPQLNEHPAQPLRKDGGATPTSLS